MSRIGIITGIGVAVLAATVGLFVYLQASNERLDLTADLQYRTRIISDGLEESLASPLQRRATTTIVRIITRAADNARIGGIVVYDNTGAIIARTQDVSDMIAESVTVATVMDSAQPSGTIVRDLSESTYTYIDPLVDDRGTVIGAVLVAQDASYIDESVWQVWQNGIVRLVINLMIFGAIITALVRWVFYRPLARLSESLGAIRRGETTETLDAEGLFAPLAGEISKMSASLASARKSASEEARMRLEKLDTPWTSERLKEFIKAYIKDRPIFVLSNAEPYVHTRTNGHVEWSVPAGGVVTALDPVMEATGGVWIAHGRGNADRESADADGTIKVPPDDPRYTLKRIFLSDEEVKGYYNGFANEALWPLCHMAHVRPLFRQEDWEEYRKVNVLFATALLDEIRGVERPLILVQDYHLALTPAIIKKARPDAQVAIFWHIPWPSAAQFSICPQRKEILLGLMGADLFGFHTQQYCNNFLDTVANEIEARIDFEHFAVHHDEHRTLVRPFPISIAFSGGDTGGEGTGKQPPSRTALDRLNIHTDKLLLGVDRLDYTKGIIERFRGFEFLLEKHPEYRERVTLLQIGAPTREGVGAYREYATRVKAEAQRINDAFGTRDWRPIVFEHRNYSHKELLPLFRLADACVVTPLHDGMNLVAKEYVSARDDKAGCLVLSHFTGASRDLKGALIVNPYSAEDVSDALHQALTMSKTDQYRRMEAMRNSVRDYNVYRWSAEIIKALAQAD